MRIISKFHDYYDVGQRYDLDRDLIYLRERREIVIKETYNKIDKLIVGFCGKVVPIIKIYKDLCFSLDEVDVAVERNYPDIYKYWLSDDVRYYRRIERKYGEWSSEHHFLKWYKRCWISDFFGKSRSELNVLFRTHNTPIWMKTFDYEERLIINPSLKEIDWQSRMDPITCYQEISMYLGGVLGADNKPIPHVSNNDLIAAKGFDKFSFRKEKK